VRISGIKRNEVYRRRNESETAERTSSGYFERATMHVQGNFFGGSWTNDFFGAKTEPASPYVHDPIAILEKRSNF
jgi:hypothetical protein